MPTTPAITFFRFQATSSSCTSAPTAFSNCAGGGVVPAGDHLWFPQGSTVPRQATTIGIPVLVVVGYVHYKRTVAFKSEVDVILESQPYQRRIIVNIALILALATCIILTLKLFSYLFFEYAVVLLITLSLFL